MSAVVADHTSDDSYIYQLSLILATATMSLIHLIKGYISLHSCQILSPSETGFIVSAHRLTRIILLTLTATL